MSLGEREFTTEEVAVLCGVTRVTVADWIGRGRLNARWTPGGHRRVDRESLATFMAQQGYSVPREVATANALVAVVGDVSPVREQIEGALREHGRYDVTLLDGGADAVVTLGATAPDAIVIFACCVGLDPRMLVSSIRQHERLQRAAIIVALRHDEESSAFRRYGADVCFRPETPADACALLDRVLAERQRRVAA